MEAKAVFTYGLAGHGSSARLPVDGTKIFSFVSGERAQATLPTLLRKPIETANAQIFAA